MKRLISLLGSLSLVATSSVAVVACGTDKSKPSDPNKDLKALIDQLIKDVELTTDDYWKTRNSNFFDLSTNPSSLYDFLKKEDIIKYVTKNGGGAIKGDHLTENEKGYLATDIDKVLAAEQMKRYFQTNIDQEKYALLIEGIEFYQGFEPDWESLEINYTNASVGETKAEEENDDFISYVSLNLNLKFQYLDINNEMAEFNLAKRFIFTLTSNGILIESIQNLEKNVVNDYYLNGGEYSWIDSKNFGFNLNEDKQKIFRPLNSDFKKIYEDNSDFKDSIINFMLANYFSQITAVPLAFTGDIIFDSFVFNDYMSANKNLNEFDWSSDAGKKIYNSIFSKLEHDQTATVFGKLGTDVNTAQYKYLTNNFMNFYDKYNTRNIEKLAELEKEANKKLNTDKQLAFDNSIGNGLIKLKGLSINVNDSYIHPINDFSIFISMAVKSDETLEDRNDIRQSHMFGAMYTNLELGVKKFQDVFDIKTRDDIKIGALPVVRFSGQGITVSGEKDNIWNNIKSSGNQYPTQLNESLSLSTPTLIKHRDVLFEEGIQRTFRFAIGKEHSTIRTMMKKAEKGIVIAGYYYSGDEYLNWNFEQNFINVDFKITGVWKQRDAIIIEKVTKD